MRKRLVVLGYVVAGCAGIPVFIYGFISWREEGFYIPGKFPTRSGGAGFVTFLLGVMLLAYSILGLQYHFTSVDRLAIIRNVMTTQPSNQAMELTASRRFTQLSMTSNHQPAATRALARGSSSCSR
jgi:hypothetical protein